MSNRYVDVVITRQTAAVSQQGFGTPLILATSKVAAYTEYTDISGIGTDFGTSSNEYKLANAIFAQSPRPAKIAIYGILYDGTTTSQLTDALNTLILAHNDWYYLTCPEQSDAEVTALANWISTQDKMYFFTTSNKTLNALNVENAVGIVVPDPTVYAAEAWVGYGAPQDIGSFTWSFKTLNGINPSGYTETDISTIETSKLNTYITQGGVNITSNSQTTTGEFVDVIESTHYVKARMTENVFGLLARSPKIPFTDAGIAQVVHEVETTLKQAFDQGIIASDDAGKPIYSIQYPKRSELSTNQRASRVLPNVKWSATIAGAVHNVDINGSLEV